MKKFYGPCLSVIILCISAGLARSQVTNVSLRSFCGPSCLTVFLKIHGVQAELEEICRVSEKDATGTSLYGLEKAANSKNIYTKAIKIKSVKTLENIGYPAIVLLKPKSGETGHFVLVMGHEKGELKIIDPPYVPYKVSVKQISNKIEGSVLLLSTSPIDLGFIHTDGVKYVFRIVIGVLIVLFLLLFFRKTVHEK